MNDTQTLIDLIDKKEKLVAMIAPSFPIVFSYPSIITMLRKLGFSYVVEVAVGAKKTNEQLMALFASNPTGRYITSPCPTIVRMIKKVMPQYEKYLTHGVDSPMAATAKIVREKYPGYKPVFIGPCMLKKMEAKEDVPELDILVVTYLELSDVLAHYSISEELNAQDHFDIAEQGMTRIYPTDGGLTKSSQILNQLNNGEIMISSSTLNTSSLKEFETNQNIKLLDILNCAGGCISGPGIKSNLTVAERRKKILDYYASLAI